MKTPIYYAAALVLALLLAGIGVQTWRLQNLRTSVAEQQHNAAKDYAAKLDKVRQDEHANAARNASIAGAYQSELSDIRDATARIPADIRSGVLKLRDYWSAQASLPQAGASAGSTDATEQRRNNSAQRIVQATDTCVAQVRALQKVVIEDRRLCGGATP